jgi:hypothetical protein
MPARDPSDSPDAAVAKFQARKRRTIILLIVFALLIPLGCVVPYSVLGWLPEGTPRTVAGIAGFVIPLVALIGLILMISDTLRWKKASGVAEHAKRMGFAYTDAPTKKELALLRQTHMFGEADSDKCLHLLRGEVDGRPVLVADYSAAYGGGTAVNVFDQTVVILSDAADGPPDLLIYPKGRLNVFEKMFGERQLPVRDDPEFDRAFVLKGEDEAAVTAAVSPAVRSLFLEDPTVTVEVREGWIYVTRLKRIQPPANYPELIDEAVRFADAFESSVRS